MSYPNMQGFQAPYVMPEGIIQYTPMPSPQRARCS